MPGQIESVPFLSQIEDVDKYLLEYRSLKLTSPSHSGNFNAGGFQQQQVQGQLRYNNSSAGKVNNDVRDTAVAGKLGVNGETLPTGNFSDGTAVSGSYGNGMKGGLSGSNFNGPMMANRKKYVANGNQGYRYNNHSNGKFNVQYGNTQVQQKHQAPGLVQNTMIANHFKQVYPQMSYNGAGSGTNLALEQLSTSFMIPNQMPQQQKVPQAQQGYPSSASSPSPAPPRVDTALSGSSSISSFNSNIDHGNSNAQFNGSQFQNYLDSGLVSSPSLVSGISSGANIYSLANGDGVAGYSSSSLAAEHNNSTSNSMTFEPAIQTPVLGPESISSDRVAGEVNLAGFEAPSASMNTNPTNNLLMGDYSVGWGSNHANTSSNTSGAFGIWNNDMSVWS